MEENMIEILDMLLREVDEGWIWYKCIVQHFQRTDNNGSPKLQTR